ncbi:MAG TPA: uridine kinase [Gemmatimonadales bacterium]|nr:uridine kinase [Gemmatimonadales bacterium]
MTPRPRPLIIGVVGGSGSGKTTVARAILGATDVDAAFLDQDAYYADLAHLTLDERRQVNFDHPDSLDNDLMVAQLEALAAGQAIDKPTYDFAAHTRAAATVRVEPADVVIVDGILLFTEPRLRELFDIKIFVDVADDLRFIRRLQRDVTERGRTMADVIRQYITTVRPMHLEFVEPSKRHADVIIPEGGHNRIGVEMVIARVRQELRQRVAS